MFINKKIFKKNNKEILLDYNKNREFHFNQKQRNMELLSKKFLELYFFYVYNPEFYYSVII